MSIDLRKNQTLILAKEETPLQKIGIGLSWDVNPTLSNSKFDLDASVFMLGENGKIPKEEYFIFYRNLESPDGSVQHYGDNRTGDVEGDDETIRINLSKIDESIKEIVIVVTIFQDESKKLDFGQVNNCSIRIYDWDTKKKIAKYDLSEDFSKKTGFEMGKLHKNNNEDWLFQSIGRGYEYSLQDFVSKYYGQ